MAPLGRWTADLVTLLVVGIWAMNNVILKVAVHGWVTPGAFNAVRLALAALLISGVALAMEGSLRVPRPLLGRVALLGVVGNGLNQMFYIYGLTYSTAGNAAVWMATLPVVVALLSSILGLERITPRIWVGAVVSTAGLILVLAAQGGGLRNVDAGDLLLAGATVTWAVYTVFSRPLAQQISPLRVTAVAMAFAAAGLLAVNAPAIARQDFTAVPMASWLGMLYAAALSNATGYALYTWSVRRLGAARVALHNNLGPILTAAGAWFILREVWAPLQLAGVGLVIGGVAVARWDDFQRAIAARGA